MKVVYAYIKKSKFDDVSLALHEMSEVSGITVTGARGWGRSGDDSSDLKQYVGRLEENLKIEVVCPDELSEKVASAIRRSAHTGVRGDGVVYVVDVESAGRIGSERRTNDRADEA